MDRKHIKYLEIKAYSGYNPSKGKIPCAKKHEYFIKTDITISGDAPKDLIRYYQYDGICKKVNPKSWDLYIAKHGEKHYPNEVITEYLLNRIGEVLGFNMAKSKLLILGGQIRFLSKYFLDIYNNQALEHGADLYAGFLNDKNFVEEIERQHQSTNFFTVQFTEQTFKHLFPEYWENLMLDFLKLLILDGIIGNNDRHFYNWGIVRNLKQQIAPSFSPIYDTARGLFWNDDDNKIKTIYQDKKRLENYIEKYCEHCYPKIGWDGQSKPNHFQLIENICKMDILEQNCDFLKSICSNKMLNKVFRMIDNEFSLLMTYQRISLIKTVIQYRFNRIQNFITFAP